MTTVTADEARDRLPELLDRVAAGEKVTITVAGRPAAELTAAPRVATAEEEAAAIARGEEALQQLLTLRAELEARWAAEGRLRPKKSERAAS
jgi:prevent-host-death family protein